jgi:hypothetical protein
MLEILSETKDPTRVEPHLKKCFEGISKLTFTDSFAISRMASVEGESIAFKTLVDTARARGSVEKWLLEVEASMFESVHAAVAQGIGEYPARKRHEWVLQWPGMVVLVVTAIFWTQGACAAILGATTQAYADQCTYVPVLAFAPRGTPLKCTILRLLYAYQFGLRSLKSEIFCGQQIQLHLHGLEIYPQWLARIWYSISA